MKVDLTDYESYRNMPCSKNFEKNGECSKCGACCAAILYLTDQEIEDLKVYARDHGYMDKRPNGPAWATCVLDLDCMFLNRTTKRCEIYDHRPSVCRVFRCSMTMGERDDVYARTDIPGQKRRIYNTWNLIDQVGLALGGKTIKIDTFPPMDIFYNGEVVRAKIGQVFEVLHTKTGEVYSPTMYLGNNGENVMITVEGGSIIDVPFSDIDAIILA